MSFLHVDASVLKVPGRMDLDELAFLASLAHAVPAGGHIVEVGAFYGRSTTAMARTNPNVSITSIDTFENVPWTARYAAQFKDVPPFGRAAFDLYTQDLQNVCALQGPSPQVATDWATPIDLYFEDAVHGNPGLKQNLEFWTARLSPGGVACGHDYNRRFPDVKAEVDALARRWNTSVSVVGSLWAVQKPSPVAANRDAALMPRLSNQPRLTLRSFGKRSGRQIARDGYWCGSHLDTDRLKWVRIDDIAARTGLSLEYRIDHPNYGRSDWVPAGQPAGLRSSDGAAPFSRLAVRVQSTDDRPAPHVIYRVSARQRGRGGASLSGTSPWAVDGAWTALPSAHVPVNAFCVALVDKLLPNQQCEFQPSLRTQLRYAQKSVARRLATLTQG